MASLLKEMRNLPSMKVAPEKSESCEVAPAKGLKEHYPYGLRLSLNKDSLKKLKLSVKDFKVKDKVMVMAEAEVCEVRSSSDEYSEHENVELKITNMTCAPKKTRRS